MDALKAFDEKAYKDLLKTEPKSWCRAFFSKNARCGDVCNNLSESFNRTIRDARRFAVINMLEEIRRQTMKRISRRHDQTQGCKTEFPPLVMEIFEGNRKSQQICSVIKSSENIFEVIEGNESYEVNIFHRHCACNQWGVTGILFMDEYFSTRLWQDTYKNNIKLMNGKKLWKKTNKGPILVPGRRRTQGRPKEYARIKEAHESSTNPGKLARDGRVFSCTNCKQQGHNKSTCTKEVVLNFGPKNKIGRPRKIQNGDPWSIQNAPRRRNTTQPLSQTTLTQDPTTTQTETPIFSTALASVPSSGRRRGHLRGSGRGQ